MLLRVGAEGVLTARSARLDAASETVRGNDPHRILSLGFAIVRHNGKAQRRANTLTRGDELEIELSQGEIKQKYITTMATKEIKYAEAMAELETILAKMNSAENDIDTLSTQVARATELIRICRTRLKKVEADVSEILDETSPKE